MNYSRKPHLVVLFIVLFCVCSSFVFKHDTKAYEKKEYTDQQLKFLEEVYEHMINRDEQFKVSYKDYKMRWDIDDIYYVIAQIDSKSNNNDYDYLRGNISEIECISTHRFLKGTTVEFKITWLEDKEQTEYVDNEIRKILERYDVYNMTDYRKVEFIHDYIVKNISYDNSKTYFSAYDGLARGETVCQGFALLTYRMLAQAGVRSRYIVGKYAKEGSKEEESHAWNLVKLGDNWYYLDTTWDACTYNEVKTDKSMRYYFLKGSNSFDKEHVPDEIENGEDIFNLYNISRVDYIPSMGGGLSQDTDDEAITPHEFFRKKGDGTAYSSSKLLAFFDNIYNIVTTRFLEIIALFIISAIIIKVIKKRRE